MPRGSWLIALLLFAMFPPAGCGRSTARTTTPKASKAVTSIPLPEWAPKNPSPEYMRAWKVLKPTPQEAFAEFAKGDPGKAMLLRRVSKTWGAAYEFFGTLTDQQMQRFLSVKEVRMPVKSLTARQRAGLDNWLECWRREMKGNGSVPDDVLVLLLKMGARRDLSNVDVGFTAQNEGHRVHIIFWRGPESSFKTDFANM
jgi:hypothetical protein